MQKRGRSKRFLREPMVLDKTGLSHPTLWRLERLGLFPQRIKLTGGAVGWLESEVDAWIDEKANSRSEASA